MAAINSSEQPKDYKMSIFPCEIIRIATSNIKQEFSIQQIAADLHPLSIPFPHINPYTLRFTAGKQGTRLSGILWASLKATKFRQKIMGVQRCGKWKHRETVKYVVRQVMRGGLHEYPELLEAEIPQIAKKLSEAGAAGRKNLLAIVLVGCCLREPTKRECCEGQTVTPCQPDREKGRHCGLIRLGTAKPQKKQKKKADEAPQHLGIAWRC